MKHVDRKPMLAEKYDKTVKLPASIYVQPKIDGIRVTVNVKTGVLMSRLGNPIRVDHISDAIIKSCGDSLFELTLDGELYVHGLDFPKTVSAVKNRMSRNHHKVTLIVFDAMLPAKFSKRQKLYEQVVELIDSKSIQSAVSCKIDSVDLNDYHKKFVEHGFEGTMIRIDGPHYENRRTWNLMKLKDFKDMDCRIIGFQEEKTGSGDKKDTLGAFVMLTPDNVEFTAVPMTTHVNKKRIWKNQKKWLNKIVTVKYQLLLPSGAPRHPNVYGLRFEQEPV